MDRRSGGRCSGMMREICAAVAVLVTCVLSIGVAYGGVPEVARTERRVEQVWTCAMHGEVRTAKPGRCPICLMELVPVRKQEPFISVPEGELQQFCERYIEDALVREEDDPPFAPFILVRAYADMKGRDVAPRLRELLAGSDLYYVTSAAIGLGELGDRQSIGQMKRLLASERLQLQPQEGSLAFGRALNARLAVAGALHGMGEPEGLSALLEMAEEPYGNSALRALALRDTSEVRNILTRVTLDRSNAYRRAAAVAGLLHLGKGRYLPDAIELLASEDEPVRWEALAGLAGTPGPDAEEALTEYLSREDVSAEEKRAAAEVLIRLGRKKQAQSETEAAATAQREAELMKLLEDALALDQLGRVGTEEQLPLLRRVIEQDPDRRLEAVAAAISIFHRQDGE